jgi:hypothetical protein
MSTVPFSNLYSYIRKECMKAPQPLMDVCILDAAREFCRRSWYRQQSIPANVAIGKAWNLITPPNTDEEVIRFTNLQYNGQTFPLPLCPVVQSDVDGVSNPCQPGWYYEPPNWLVVLPAPTSSLPAGYYVRAVLQPTSTATTLDYTLVQQYDRAIAHGALKLIFSTNDCEWTDPKKAERSKFEFEEGIQQAAAARQTNFLPRNLLTAVPRF